MRETNATVAAFEGSDLEHASCPACESSASQMQHEFSPFQVQRCQSCGFIFLSPRLTEERMRQVYESHAYFEGDASGYDRYSDQEIALRLTFSRLLGELRKRGVDGGSVLDVGCGYGWFLQEAGERFSTRVGLELSPESAAIARQHADEVLVGGLEKLEGGRQFSVVTAIQVIEHVYAPKAFLRDLLHAVEPGGSALIATPDIGSFWYPMLGRRWPSFKIPEHVLYFTGKSLSAMMEGCGFCDTQIVPYPHAFPLGLFFKKLGLRAPRALAERSLWFPRTTVAVLAKRPNAHGAG